MTTLFERHVLGPTILFFLKNFCSVFFNTEETTGRKTDHRVFLGLPDGMLKSSSGKFKEEPKPVYKTVWYTEPCDWYSLRKDKDAKIHL